MCGIWGLLKKQSQSWHGSSTGHIFEAFLSTRARGPDRSEFRVISPYALLGFHRLAICDLSVAGDQPFVRSYVDERGREHEVFVQCNGEIYEHALIAQQEGLQRSEFHSHSDCEVIALLYVRWVHAHGPEAAARRIAHAIRNAEFAFSILDSPREAPEDSVLLLARDPLGVRPLFWGIDAVSQTVAFSSVLKGLVGVVPGPTIAPFPPGHVASLRCSFRSMAESAPIPYIDLFSPKTRAPVASGEGDSHHKEVIFAQLRKLLSECVERMCASDRPMGALLSGGLDSSLVVAEAARVQARSGRTLRTFSIGLPGSTDEKYARMVAEHCGTIHTHVEFAEEEFLAAIAQVVEATETYDVTTVRASVGQYLISRWIAQNTDVRVLLLGDGSDELFAGYLYFKQAPDAAALHEENCRLLREIHLFDVLRADRGVASHGLEARAPFLSADLVEYVLSLDPHLRSPYQGEEKWLLREAYRSKPVDGRLMLPLQVLSRRKEAFSDGVSSTTRSWYQVIQERMQQEVEQGSDAFVARVERCGSHLPPKSPEALHYRELFNARFGSDLAHVIPHYWMPRWIDATDPSARTLTIY